MSTLKLIFLCILMAISFLAQAETADSAFTYQGELKQQNAPATGSYDFRFELFDADSNGNSVATAIQIENVAVINGTFTVELGFGSAPFNGDKRWLELSVRDGASVDPHVVLSPRQVITSAPYAVKALKVFDRVVVVSGAHTPTENGAVALEAVAFIQSQGPSAKDPWLIQLEPGTFDIGAGTLQLPDYVSLKGSGIHATALKSQSNESLRLCSFCTIENLKVSNESPIAPGNRNTIVGVNKQDVFLHALIIELFHDFPGEPIADQHAALRIINPIGRVTVSDTRIDASAAATGGIVMGLQSSGTGVSPLTLSNVEITVEGTNNVWVGAIDVWGVTIEGSNIKLKTKSDTNRSIGIVGQVTDLLSGTMKGINIESLSNYFAYGILLHNSHSLDFTDLNIETNAPISRAFELVNENADEFVEAVSIRDSTIRATGNDSRGIVFRQGPGDATKVGLTLFNTDVSAICDLDKICYSLDSLNEGAELLELNVIETHFTCKNYTNPETSQGIFIHSLKATFQNSTSTAFWSPLLVDYNAPALASDILFQGGSLNATTTAIYSGGNSNVSVQSAIIGGWVDSQGGATTTCVASIVNGVFKASGC